LKAKACGHGTTRLGESQINYTLIHEGENLANKINKVYKTLESRLEFTRGKTVSSHFVTFFLSTNNTHYSAYLMDGFCIDE